MAGSEKKTLRIRLKRWISVFESVMFWFTIVAISYVILTSHELLSLRFSEATWWNEFYSISSAFLIGALISFLFYFLVVFLPERKKRIVIKNNLQKLYKDIKQDILYQVIFASQKGGRQDLSADSETVDRLSTIEGFKEAFEGGQEADEGFYAFQNYISDDVPEYRAIILSLGILAKQIDFVLHNYPITDSNVFDFFKRLEIFLMRLESIGPGYEEEKPLSRLIWEIFAGWNWIEGDRGYDIVEKMIGDI